LFKERIWGFYVDKKVEYEPLQEQQRNAFANPIKYQARR